MPPWAKPPDGVGLSSPDVLALGANMASLSDQGSLARVRLLPTDLPPFHYLPYLHTLSITLLTGYIESQSTPCIPLSNPH
jgi:hypothetical protein